MLKVLLKSCLIRHIDFKQRSWLLKEQEMIQIMQGACKKL
jgi:hypothetical protein